MRKASIIRNKTGDSGTFGRLTLDDGWSCHTGELPSRDNASNKSCIPAGVYHAHITQSLKYGACYMLNAVPGQYDVEIHAANWKGDEEKGFKCQLGGCISLGLIIGMLDGQDALLHSGGAVSRFMTRMGFGDPFELTISEFYA